MTEKEIKKIVWVQKWSERFFYCLCVSIRRTSLDRTVKKKENNMVCDDSWKLCDHNREKKGKVLI